MLLVNFAAGPGAGKSTTSAYVFAKLKMAGIKAELVGEEAKDLVYNRAIPMLDNQILLFGQQYQRAKRLEEAGAEVAISDSPFVLNGVYSKDKPYEEELIALVRAVERLYPDTLNIFVRRVKPFVAFGRTQAAVEEARRLDTLAWDLLKPVDLTIDGDEEGAIIAVNEVFKRLKK